MRADARKHRLMLVEAAARVFARDGHEVPLQAIVREAGLGRGTLYRHFADREALIGAVIDHELDMASQFVAERAGDAALFRDFLRQQSILVSFHTPAILRMEETRIESLIASISGKIDELFQAVTAAALRFGQVSPAFGVADLELVIKMVAGATKSSHCSPEDAIERALDLIIEGLRPR